jgi:hypothetical protein
LSPEDLHEKASREISSDENRKKMDEFFVGLEKMNDKSVTAIVLSVEDNRNFTAEFGKPKLPHFTANVKLVESGEINFIIEDSSKEGLQPGDFIVIEGLRRSGVLVEAFGITVQPDNREYIKLQL